MAFSRPTSCATSSSARSPSARSPCASGTAPSCPRRRRRRRRRSRCARRAAVAHVLRAPGPARPRPRLRLRRARRRRHRRGARLLRDVVAAADRRRARRPRLAARRRPRGGPAAPAAIRRPPSCARAGRRHTIGRDARAVRHHYDVSNEFFALFLDDSMTYWCAIFETPRRSRWRTPRPTSARPSAASSRWSPASACWTSAAAGAASPCHAAERPRRAASSGITLSEPQAGWRAAARRGARRRRPGRDPGHGLPRAARRAVRRDRRRSGWSSTSAARNIDAYAALLAGLLTPGGRLLNHGIARLRHGEAEAGPFSERYVFADAAPLHLSRVQLALERAGLVTDHVEGYAEHYARTLTHWGAEPGRRPAAGRRRSSAPSACTSGGSTCARRATASRPASRRSTRCARSAPPA